MRRHPKLSDASHGDRTASHSQTETAAGTATATSTSTSTDNTRHTPSKKHPYQHDIEFFANNQFSRSFSSLIIEDVDAQPRSKRVLNKSPPFNLKHTASISNALEGNSDDDADKIETNADFFDYGSDLDSDSDLHLSSDHESRTDHGLEQYNSQQKLPQNSHTKGVSDDKDLKDSLIFSGSLSPLRPPSKPLLKRSSKYFNLSIDVQGHSSPPSSKESKFTSSPLAERGTPFNKFKRPHQLVSQSPSPSSNNRLKVLNGTGSPSKSEKTSKMFKNSTNSRIKSPLRLGSSSSTTSPTAEFCIKKLGKSPNLRFMSSSSPLKNHAFNDTLGVYDESPSRPKRPSASNFHVYHDEDRVPSIMSKSHTDPYQTSTSVTSVGDSNKENQNRKPIKSAKKASFKLVKPLQAAFESSGLRKKSSQPKFSKKAPPETPMKRQPLMIITKDMNKPHDYDNSFFNNDHSIEVGRNTSGVYLDSNDSNTSFFKFPSSEKSEVKAKSDYPDPLDLDMDIIPETPTKSSSRGKKLNILIEDMGSKFPSRPEGVFETDPCTPISQFPTESVISSQATLSSPNAYGDSSNDRTVTYHTSNVDHTGPSKPDIHSTTQMDLRDERLVEKFGRSNIRYIGSGQFSVAFECNFQNQKFAIKRNKKPVSSNHEKKALLREIDALKALTSFHEGETEVAEGKENLVFFVEAWSSNNFFYIMTEFCEGGTLNDFLDDHRNYKIDEFRVWKILIEILSGLKYIHSKNYLHLDLKPANIFVTFDGSLKIGDFGLSAKLPILEEDFDLEGDKRYIAPELMDDKIYTPYADIFSVGMVIVEIATNSIIPGNGTPWKKLRSGDLSDVGKLSSDNISDFLNHKNFSSLTSYDSSFQSIGILGLNQNMPSHRSGISCSRSVPEQSITSFSNRPSGELLGKPSTERVREIIPKGAPQFLLDNSACLDSLVNRMMAQNPFDRISAGDILMRKECLEIEARRKAGATIFEGEFGPNDD